MSEGDLLGAIPRVTEQALPFVVHVKTEDGNGTGFVAELGDGSAPVLVTNAHVVADLAEAEVVFAGGISCGVAVVGHHPLVDIAVLECADELPTPAGEGLRLRARRQIRLGEVAVAVGSPLGLQSSVSLGVVSGLDRLRANQDGTPVTMIQTDAAINPGNSGGPLVGLDGLIVGVNTQGTVRNHVPLHGLNFAIPAHLAGNAAAAIRAQSGIPRHGAIGAPIALEPSPLPRELQRDLGRSTAARVKGPPQPDSPASDAGLTEGDLIVAIDDDVVDDPGDIFSWLVDHDCANREWELKLVREEQLVDTTIKPRLS